MYILIHGTCDAVIFNGGKEFAVIIKNLEMGEVILNSPGGPDLIPEGP